MLTLEYKLDGTPAQYAAIAEAIRTVQFIRNICLRQWMDGQGVSRNDLQASCALLAQQFPFVAALNSQARQASADRAWVAIARFYARCREHTPGKKGYPQFQRDGRSVEYKVTGWKLAPNGKHLTFTDGQGIGTLRLVGTRAIETFPIDQIQRVRIVRRADGYYCQFCVRVERHVTHWPTGVDRGIDVGLSAFYTDSEGATVENPRYLRRSEARVRRRQRAVSRKSNYTKDHAKPKNNHRARKRRERSKHPRQSSAALLPVAPPAPSLVRRPQSTNYQKARQRLARLHLRIHRQREDFARKTASALISSSDLIAFEDLRIRNMVKNHTLAKSISDTSWGAFLRWVRYYAQLQMIPTIAVPAQYTSQDCSGVLPDGSRCPERIVKSLHMRTHACPRCGLILDRDHNAARVIKDAAYRIVGRTRTG